MCRQTSANHSASRRVQPCAIRAAARSSRCAIIGRRPHATAEVGRLSRRLPDRTASRRAQSESQPEKRNENCGKAIQVMKTDPPTVHRRLR